MFSIRWMIRRDMPDVLQLCQQYQILPHKEEQILDWLRHRNCIGMIAETGPYDKHYEHDVIVGFMIYELYNELVNVIGFVASDAHCWNAMTDKLYKRLSSHRRHCVLWDGIRVIRGDGHPLFLRKEEVGEERILQMKRLPMTLRWDVLVDAGVVAG